MIFGDAISRRRGSEPLSRWVNRRSRPPKNIRSSNRKYRYIILTAIVLSATFLLFAAKYTSKSEYIDDSKELQLNNTSLVSLHEIDKGDTIISHTTEKVAEKLTRYVKSSAPSAQNAIDAKRMQPYYVGKSKGPNAKNLKIAIVTSAVVSSENRDAAKNMKRFNEYLANKQCYAELHGYDLIVDSRNHVENMGFYVDSDKGTRGPTNVHFNKPFLLKKWILHYDWLLWLDLDCLIVDMERPLDWFIEKFTDETHVLVPQDQNNVLFFSAYALLIRGSKESKEMLDDWFALKDTCPFAMYDDQSRLYSALLRMQLRVQNIEVNEDSKTETDCLIFCQSKETQKAFSWCFDRSVKNNGYSRMPNLKGPVAFSTLPTNEFRYGDDTGLAMQGMFGGVQVRPELVHKAFAVHVKPVCLNGTVACAPFLDIILGEKYNGGMKKCYGNNGWISNASDVLTKLSKVEKGPIVDDEMYGKDYVPALNINFSIPFNSNVNSNLGVETGFSRYEFRSFGSEADSLACIASIPAAGGDIFVAHVLEPYMSNLRCRFGSMCRGNTLRVEDTEGRKHTPCHLPGAGHHFPYTLTEDYKESFQQPSWLISFVRNPVDRTIISWLQLTSADENRHQCVDGAYPRDRAKTPSLTEYIRFEGSNEIYAKFFGSKSWHFDRWNQGCVGRAPKWKFQERPKDKKAFHYYQGNFAAATLLEYQYFGVYEYWEQSMQLLEKTLNIGRNSGGSGERVELPTLSAEEALALELPSDQSRNEFRRLRNDSSIRNEITAANPTDTMFYDRAVGEFKRRCRYLNVEI